MYRYILDGCMFLNKCPTRMCLTKKKKKKKKRLCHGERWVTKLRVNSWLTVFTIIQSNNTHSNKKKSKYSSSLKKIFFLNHIKYRLINAKIHILITLILRLQFNDGTKWNGLESDWVMCPSLVQSLSSAYHPQVTLCSWQDVKSQSLTYYYHLHNSLPTVVFQK